MADYSLPDLPYDYGALDPHISGKIMELHHSKHHQNYVNGLNTALEKLEEARASESFDTINLLEKNLAFNLGGHINHSIFWKNLSPEGGDKPDGDLGAAIDDHFGSFDAYRGQFEAHGARASRVPAGPSPPGTPSARSSSSCSCTTSRATSPRR